MPVASDQSNHWASLHHALKNTGPRLSEEAAGTRREPSGSPIHRHSSDHRLLMVDDRDLIPTQFSRGLPSVL